MVQWQETEVRDMTLNPANVGIQVNPSDVFLLNARGFYLLLGSKFSEEELTREKFIDLYYKFLELAEKNGFKVDKSTATITNNWIDNQLERINYKRKFAKEISEMLESNK